MNSKIIIVLLLASIVLFFGCTQTVENVEDTTDNTEITDNTEVVNDTTNETIDETTEVQDETNTTTGETKVFVLTGDKFRFFLDGEETPTLRVNEGDTVRIELSAIDMPHDWVVDELAVRTEIFAPGSSGFVEFVANQKGTFEYYCSVGSHKAMGMTGTLIIE